MSTKAADKHRSRFDFGAAPCEPLSNADVQMLRLLSNPSLAPARPQGSSPQPVETDGEAANPGPIEAAVIQSTALSVTQQLVLKGIAKAETEGDVD